MAHRAAKFRSRYLNAEYQMRRKNYFKQSFDLYQRAIRIVEENYGDKDLRLIEPLRGLALAKLSKGFGIKTASESLRRVVDVVKANPGSDVGDIARATVDLGDLYTRVGMTGAPQRPIEKHGMQFRMRKFIRNCATNCLAHRCDWCLLPSKPHFPNDRGEPRMRFSRTSNMSSVPTVAPHDFNS